MANRIENPGTWTTDKSKFVYVELPAQDMYGYEYPTIRINNAEFKAGQKHFVPPEIGEELHRIMERFEKDARRLFMPTPDRRAQQIADNTGSSGLPNG